MADSAAHAHLYRHTSSRQRLIWKLDNSFTTSISIHLHQVRGAAALLGILAAPVRGALDAPASPQPAGIPRGRLCRRHCLLCACVNRMV